MSTVKNKPHTFKTWAHVLWSLVNISLRQLWKKLNIVFSKLVNHDFNYYLVEFKVKIWWNTFANTCAKSKIKKVEKSCTGITAIIRNCARNLLDYWRGHSNVKVYMLKRDWNLQGAPEIYMLKRVGERHPKFTCSKGLEGAPKWSVIVWINKIE